jgi:tRNA-2-methylthio-N6-dimethylallyladenosine synthase
MNKNDSERIASVLEKAGYKPVKASSSAKALAKADLIVVNMCSVRQSAVDRVYGLTEKLKNLKTKKFQLRAILTGCILEEDKRKFKKEFGLILNIKDLPNWPKYLSPNSHDRTFYDNYLEIQPKYQNNFSVFVPISNGCNNFCSYCVVPYVRGPLVCRNHQEILKEVKNLIKKGYKEIWLLGQNVNDYISRPSIKRIETNNQRIFVQNSLSFVRNSGDTVNFAKLLKMVNDIPKDFWIRFTSPHPASFSDESINTMAKCQKVTPYLNLPVQSGDDEVLKRMNRPYKVSQYKNLVKKIRQAFRKYRQGMEKEVAISTDVIVGFPGETRRQLENTAKLMRKIKFDMAYIAQYSARPQTAAFKLKDDVPAFEKQKRERELTKILEKSALNFNRKFFGKTVDVLVSEKKKGFYLGKTRHHQTIKLKSGKDILGKFVKIKVIKIMAYGLEGKLME